MVGSSRVEDKPRGGLSTMSAPREKRTIGTTSLSLETLGLGCASVGNLYQPVSDLDARGLLESAWQSGFRYFDTAPHYGQGLSERRVGDFLREKKISEYVISTKVGRLLRPAGYARERHGFISPMPFNIHYDYSYDGVMRSYEDSLQRLGLDSVDMLYVHDIGTYTHGEENDRLFTDAMKGGYKALDQLRSHGAVKAIGLGVNEYQVCEAALEYGDWDCFLLAGRYTLLEQTALDTFLPKCVDRQCSIVIGGVYNSGILATGVKGQGPWHYDYGQAPDEVVEKVSRIEKICDSYAVPLAAAALQFPLVHPAVASVIPGIGKPSRVRETTRLFALDIPVSLWADLKRAGLLGAHIPTPTQ